MLTFTCFGWTSEFYPGGVPAIEYICSLMHAARPLHGRIFGSGVLQEYIVLDLLKCGI